jgi:predicted nucleotidyltransferase
MILERLYRQKLIHPPKFLIANCQYLTQMGSVAYGVSGQSSDIDVYGFCIPSKELVFPHISGEIPGFGTQIQRFNVWQEHHVQDKDKQVEYDFAVYSMVSYFQLLMDNNPNIIDSIFTPQRCVIHSTKISDHIRANRLKFLHKGAYHKFKGYAYSQMSKIKSKVNSSNEKRSADIEKNGYDTKFAYHLVRLSCECEQILVEHDLDIERNSEQLKSIRRGEWTLERIEQWFENKEKLLDTLYAESTLQHSPNEGEIKQLLMECLEMFFGDLSSVVIKENSVQKLIDEMQNVIDRHKS